MKSRIIFITNSVYPVKNSGGGSIVMYRHLKRFQDEGNPVIFINTIQSEQEYKTEFTEIKLHKKKWYPPLRQATPWLTSLRTSIYLNRVLKTVHITKKDIVIAIFGDYTNLLAAKVADYFRIPLFMVYHDDSLFNEYGKQNLIHSTHIKQLIKKTDHFFAVCPPMKVLLEQNGVTSTSVLYPIPEGYSGPKKKWEDVNVNNFQFYNSGLLFEDLHLDLISKLAHAAEIINAKVSLIGNLNKSFENKLLENKSLNILRRFETTTELFSHLTCHADVLMVFYSFKFEQEHRMYHSFPSKFVEYCHLGIPVMIIAPEASAIGMWAIENKWAGYVSTDQIQVIQEMMDKFKKRSFWELCQEQASIAAQLYFSPELIHMQLSETIFNYHRDE